MIKTLEIIAEDRANLMLLNLVIAINPSIVDRIEAAFIAWLAIGTCAPGNKLITMKWTSTVKSAAIGPRIRKARKSTISAKSNLKKGRIGNLNIGKSVAKVTIAARAPNIAIADISLLFNLAISL